MTGRFRAPHFRPLTQFQDSFISFVTTTRSSDEHQSIICDLESQRDDKLQKEAPNHRGAPSPHKLRTAYSLLSQHRRTHTRRSTIVLLQSLIELPFLGYLSHQGRSLLDQFHPAPRIAALLIDQHTGLNMRAFATTLAMSFAVFVHALPVSELSVCFVLSRLCAQCLEREGRALSLLRNSSVCSA